MALAVLAGAAIVVRVRIGEATDAPLPADVHAMNGELADREALLTERLDALDAVLTTDACRTIRASAAEADRALATLPRDDGAERLAQAIALARFRLGAEDLVAVVSNAARTAATARTSVLRAASEAKAAGRSLSENVETNLIDWLRTRKEMADELAGWRAERHEKMARREFATFLVFHKAASDRYREWEQRFDRPREIQERLFGDLLPRAESASSNLLVWTSVVRRETKRSATAVDALGKIPVDPGLFESARRGALESYETTVRRAKVEMDEFAEIATAFPDDARKAAADMHERADEVEKSMGDAACRPSLSVSNAVASAIREARDGTALRKTAEFKSEWTALLEDWSSAQKRIRKGDAAVSRLRAASTTDEASVAADIAVVEDVGGLVDGMDIRRRRSALASLRQEVTEGLSRVRTRLDKADAARWKEEKAFVRSEMTRLGAEWRKPERPGWSRPEEEVSSLVLAIDDLLGDIDSVPVSRVRSKRTRILKSVSKLKSRRVWTPGVAHPDHPHVHAHGQKQIWEPDLGYAFDAPGTRDLSVHWVPGLRPKNHPHVTAGTKEGTWLPAPGYKSRASGDLDPRWTPGLRHPTKPHIVSDDMELQWKPEPGYVPLRPGTSDLSVQWKPGLPHPDFDAIIASKTEGRWEAAPGWRFVRPGTSDLRVRWVPGSRHPEKPHVHAADKEWVWSADEGYAFVQPGTSNLDVVWKPGQVSADGKRRAKKTEGLFESKFKCHCRDGYKLDSVKCVRCNGTGKTSSGLTCPECGGNKFTLEPRKCEKCGGTGWYWP